ncbi:MAG: SdpI family protein [Candidatus Nanoarchaeia archaeon]
MRKYLVYSIVLIILSFLIGAFLYSQLPDKLASHWNAVGDVDGYMSKFWGLFLLPLLCVVMFLLLVFLPKIDPLRKDMEGFRDQYDFFIALLFSFMFYLYLLTLLWNVGFRFNMSVFLVPAFSLLFFYMGLILEKSKRNWFLGIRNPWTMSSDFVWEKTHKLGGLLFKLSATIMLLGLFFHRLALFIVIVPLILTAIITIVYSYHLFKEQEKSEKKSEVKSVVKTKTKVVKKKAVKKYSKKK